MLRTYPTLAASSPTIATVRHGTVPPARSRCARAAISSRRSAASARPSNISAGIALALRAARGGALERVRWTVSLGAGFDEEALERAFAGFRRLYNVAPERVLCAPDVLGRLAALTARSADDAMSRDLRYEGITVASAILAPGTIVFEGEVDEERMGDW
jgi:hypothetical protein